MLEAIATFFAFSALILEFFTLLGNTYNVPFLRSLYFTKIDLGNTAFITFGLWNYCTGTIQDSGENVTSCSAPVPAFNWANASEIKPFIQDLSVPNNLFLANFVIYWIAFALTLGALIITAGRHFNRFNEWFASIITFIAFVLMLVVFIMLITISVKANNAAASIGSGDTAISGHLGPSMWMTLGAMIALLLGSFWYCCTCLCGRGRRAQDPPATAA